MAKQRVDSTFFECIIFIFYFLKKTTCFGILMPKCTVKILLNFIILSRIFWKKECYVIEMIVIDKRSLFYF